jgi:hypothetical protein
MALYPRHQGERETPCVDRARLVLVELDLDADDRLGIGIPDAWCMPL